MRDQLGNLRTWWRRVAATVALVLVASPANAFQVLPKVSDVDRKLATLGSNTYVDAVGQYFLRSALPMIKSPVHEAITLAALGCSSQAGSERECVTLAAIGANRVLLYGVRWPDDPPFPLNREKPPRISACDVKVTLRSTAQPKCWYGLFTDAAKLAEIAYKKNPELPAFGPGDYLLYRSHYGDLQFMHSMGSVDGEVASDTIARMKMWAKFLWGVSTQQVPTGRFIRDLGMDDLAAYFPGDMTASNLFATGIVEVRKDLDKVALGVLLHMVQDSFSEAHAERAPETGAMCAGLPVSKPGRILRFYSYARQSGSSHDEEDTFNALALHAMQASPNVVDITKEFIALWQKRAAWQDVETLFECVFDLQDKSSLAGPGRFVRQKK